MVWTIILAIVAAVVYKKYFYRKKSLNVPCPKMKKNLGLANLMMNITSKK